MGKGKRKPRKDTRRNTDAKRIESEGEVQNGSQSANRKSGEYDAKTR